MLRYSLVVRLFFPLCVVALVGTPAQARFLQTDPVGYEDDVNWYAYVQNDPTNKTDPSGDFSCVNNGNGTQTCTSNGSILDNMAVSLYSALMHAQASVNNSNESNSSDDKNNTNNNGNNDKKNEQNDPPNKGPNETPPPNTKSQTATDHADLRREEARQGDTQRQVGDPNKVVQEGRRFVDTETGNTVHVNGDRVVVTKSDGTRVTQFRNSRANTQQRIQSGRWVPE